MFLNSNVIENANYFLDEFKSDILDAPCFFPHIPAAPINTVGIRCIQPPDIFPLTSMVNKSCNIECCVNNMLQIIQNMMFSQGLELELSMFRRTTISGQHSLVF